MSENDQPKKRNFLKPLTVAVAALLASAGSDAMASPDLQAALNKANQVVIEQRIEESQPAPLGKAVSSTALCFYKDGQKFRTVRRASQKDLVFFAHGDFVNCDKQGVLILNLKTNSYALLDPDSFEIETHKCTKKDNKN